METNDDLVRLLAAHGIRPEALCDTLPGLIVDLTPDGTARAVLVAQGRPGALTGRWILSVTVPDAAEGTRQQSFVFDQVAGAIQTIAPAHIGTPTTAGIH